MLIRCSHVIARSDNLHPSGGELFFLNTFTPTSGQT